MAELISKTDIFVRFSEVDSMAVVWHGNYVKYIEDGREAFGRQYGLGYNDVYAAGYMTPIVKMELNYLKTTSYGEELSIESKLIPTDAAKVVFEYRVFRKSDNALVLKAKTVQVFMDLEGNMELTNPEFYLKWKKKNGLI